MTNRDSSFNNDELVSPAETTTHPAPMASSHALDELHRLRQGNRKLLDTLNRAKEWYRREYKIEELDIDTYPWDTPA